MKNDFSKGRIMPMLLRLAIPMTLAQLINILYNVIDRMFIGRIGGTSMDALTGVGVCLPVIMIVMAFANLIGMGGAPLFSIERGKGDEQEAEAILGNSVTLLLLFGILLTVAGLIVKVPVLRLLGASEVTLPYANDYLTIYLCGNVFVLLSLGLNSFINAQGFSKTGMFTVAIGAGLNIVLDPIFIFGLGMGVKGAALATVISQFAAALWTVRFLTGKRTILRIRKSRMRPEKNRVKRIIALGMSGFTMQVTNSVVQMVCNATLQRYGGDMYVGIMTIIYSVREIISMPISGLSGAGQPIMGFNYGAKAYDRVKKTIRYMSAILITYNVGIWVVVSAFPVFFIQLFNQDPALLAPGTAAMHIYFFGFFFMAFQSAGQTVFTALGRAKNAMFFSIFRKVIIVVPLTLLFPAIGMGVHGVFWAEPVSNAIGGLACFITMMLIVYRKLGQE